MLEPHPVQMDVQLDKDTHVLSHPWTRPDEPECLSEMRSRVVSDYPYGEAATQQRHRAIDDSA